MRNWVAPLRSYPILRAMLGGFTLGLVALFLPNVSFSGQHDLQPMYDQADNEDLGVAADCLSPFDSLTSLLLATGWKVGRFSRLCLAGHARAFVERVVSDHSASSGSHWRDGRIGRSRYAKPIACHHFCGSYDTMAYVGISIVTIGIGVLTRWLWRLGRER